jgi:hypothetical protein
MKKKKTVWNPVRSLAETISSSTQLGRENGHPRRVADWTGCRPGRQRFLLGQSIAELQLDNNNNNGPTHGKYMICCLQEWFADG